MLRQEQNIGRKLVKRTMRAVRYATGGMYRTYGAVLFVEISSTHIWAGP